MGEDPVVLIEDKKISPPELGGDFHLQHVKHLVFGCVFGFEFYKHLIINPICGLWQNISFVLFGISFVYFLDK